MNSFLLRVKSLLHAKRFLRIVLPIAAIWLAIVACLIGTIYVYGSADHAQPADVIIILGAGLRPDNTLTDAFVRRIDHAVDLWQRGLAPVIMCTGGLPGRATRPEAAACGDGLQALGVPPDAIVLEERSRSTEENAIESKTIMDAHGWRTAIIVSDGYHLLRSQWIFERTGITGYTSPVPFTWVNPVELTIAMLREIVAFHWLAFKYLLNLPITYVPLV